MFLIRLELACDLLTGVISSLLRFVSEICNDVRISIDNINDQYGLTFGKKI